MARITVEDCLDRVTNRFALVMLVAKRAKQILKGSDSTVYSPNNKYVVTALREVANGNVFYEQDFSHGTFEEHLQKDLNR